MFERLIYGNGHKLISENDQITNFFAHCIQNFDRNHLYHRPAQTRVYFESIISNLTFNHLLTFYCYKNNLDKNFIDKNLSYEEILSFNYSELIDNNFANLEEKIENNVSFDKTLFDSIKQHLKQISIDYINFKRNNYENNKLNTIFQSHNFYDTLLLKSSPYHIHVPVFGSTEFLKMDGTKFAIKTDEVFHSWIPFINPFVYDELIVPCDTSLRSFTLIMKKEILNYDIKWIKLGLDRSVIKTVNEDSMLIVIGRKFKLNEDTLPKGTSGAQILLAKNIVAGEKIEIINLNSNPLFALLLQEKI